VAMWSAQGNADVLATAIDKPVEVMGASSRAASDPSRASEAS